LQGSSRNTTYILIKSNLIKVNRIRPRTVIPDIARLDIETQRPDPIILLRPIPLKTGRDDIENTTMIPDSRSPHATPRFRRMNLKLGRPRQCMTDQSPLNEIAAVVDWGTGEVFECGGHEEEVAFNADDGGVRVEAWDYGIGEAHGSVGSNTLSYSDQIVLGFICGRIVVCYGLEGLIGG
jgi:hypothetical protein